MITYLKRENTPSLAYIKTEPAHGNNLPIMMFLGGFRSDMQGSKATYLETQCKARGQGYIRFDYRGHGQSQGKFEEACISEWAQDAIDILDYCTSRDVMLVGSSMGGWISFLTALKRSKRVHSIIGLAAAPDFTQWMEDGMSDNQWSELNNTGSFELLNDYDENPFIISRKLIEDGRTNFILENEININVPVRLIQGKKDVDVSWETANLIKKRATGSDIKVLLLNEADHRLSSPDQLEFINQVTEELLKL